MSSQGDVELDVDLNDETHNDWEGLVMMKQLSVVILAYLAADTLLYTCRHSENVCWNRRREASFGLSSLQF